MCARWNVSFTNRAGLRLSFRVADIDGRPWAAVVLMDHRVTIFPFQEAATDILVGQGVRCYALEPRRPGEPGEPRGPEGSEESGGPCAPEDLLADLEDLLCCIEDDVGSLPLFLMGCGAGAGTALDKIEAGREPSQEGQAPGPAAGRVLGPAAGRVITRVAVSGAVLLGPDHVRLEECKEEAEKDLLVATGGEARDEESARTWIRERVLPWIAERAKGKGES